MTRKIILLILILFLCGCSSGKPNYIDSLEPDIKIEPKIEYSIIEQEFNESLCSSRGYLSGGYDFLGIRLKAIDAESGENISLREGSVHFNAGGGSSVGSKMFACFRSDPSYVPQIYLDAEGHLPIRSNITSLALGKLHTIAVKMHKLPDCYYDQDNIARYSEYILQGFGLESNEYALKCMDSYFMRGGYIKSKGECSGGGNFEMFYHWGWCSSGGSDCGWTKCIAVEGNDELFSRIKNKLCNSLYYRVSNDGSICKESPFDNSDEVRQKCLDGEYESSVGNKKIISIVQISNRCSSSVEEGSADCWNYTVD